MRNTLHLPIPIKALLLLAIVLAGSMLSSFSLIPDSHFSDKRNALNIYMVKLSWGWTLLCLVPTVVFTSFLYTGVEWTLMFRHLGRILVSHLIWYFFTMSFVLLEDNLPGVCEEASITTRSECLTNRHEWNGFNISGHIFLLSYCIFVLTEECDNIRKDIWLKYEQMWDLERKVVEKLPEKKKSSLLYLYRMVSWVVELLELLATAEILLWTFMIATTSLYFHSIWEKLPALVLGYFAWLVTYNWLYGRSHYFPCKPNEGILHPRRYLVQE